MILNNPYRSVKKYAVLSLAAIALYAPVKDLIAMTNQYLGKESVKIVSTSFGGATPWQKNSAYGLVKVGHNAQSSLVKPQVIYTKLRFENPTTETKHYRKIWLSFEHKNGSQEYTTDYTLYDPQTNQRLIGQSVQLGANSHIEVIAAYRFIPSYKNTPPATMSISWQGEGLLRESACQYDLQQSTHNYFNYECL